MNFPDNCPICDVKLTKLHRQCCFTCQDDVHYFRMCKDFNEIRFENFINNISFDIFHDSIGFYSLGHNDYIYILDKSISIEEAIDFAKNKLPMIKIFK